MTTYVIIAIIAAIAAAYFLFFKRGKNKGGKRDSNRKNGDAQ